MGEVENKTAALKMVLIKERQRQGFTQSDVAKRAGFTAANVCRLEAGDHNPNLRTLVRWANVLGVEITFTPKR